MQFPQPPKERRRARRDGPRRFPLTLLLCWAAVLLVPVVTAGCGVTPSALTPAARFDDQMRLALDAYRNGNSEAGQRFLQAAVAAATPLVSAASGGTESDAYVLVGERLATQGRPAEAATFLQDALRKPSLDWSPQLWMTVAEAWALAGDRARAEVARAQAKERAERIMATAGDDGRSGDGKRRSRGADAAARLRRQAQFLQVGFFYHQKLKDTPSALRAWREAVRLGDENPYALNALGYTLADEGKDPEDFKEALDLTRKALRLAPGNPMIQDSYGWALFKTGDLAGARRELREAVDALPNEAELRYHLGVVYAQMGLTREAQTELTRALRLRNNDYPDAAKAIRRLRQPPGEGIVRGA
jgi:tetratricopeptide (TPR) repeat protein